MNRRQMKRLAASHLAERAFGMAEMPRLDLTEQDAERYREACYEFAEELYRRAGLDPRRRRMDERQMEFDFALVQSSSSGGGAGSGMGVRM